jgi:membrane protease subunit HflC
MITERKRIAAKYRSEGEGQKLEIEGRKEKEEKQILSEAYKQAQQIMGKADAEAIRTYAEAYSRDPDFYSFLETLNSYEDNLGEGSVLVLSTDGAYLKYLKGDGQTLPSLGSAPPPAGKVAGPPAVDPGDSCSTMDEQ